MKSFNGFSLFFIHDLFWKKFENISILILFLILLQFNTERAENIQNCIVYEDDNNELCKECGSEYALEDINRTICINKSKFTSEYYSKDNITYSRCNSSNAIQNCLKCKYFNSKLECTQCMNGFTLKDDNYTYCFDKSDLNINEYYYENDYHIKKCSSTLNYCKECKNKTTCTKCNDNYYFFNDINRICSRKNQVASLNDYYQENNEYYSCINFNVIPNCKECINKTSCQMCIPEYTFLNKSKLSCVKKANLGKNYTADINDNTLYRKCSECIENCETCESYNKCITCKDGFVLTFDYKCVNKAEQTYYKDPSDTQYYPCNKAIDNCEKCSSNNTCNKCIDGYVKLNNNKSKCYQIKDINIEEYYPDQKDDNNYLTCTSYIPNCLSCTFKGCYECKKGYIMLNDNPKTCYEKEKIDLSNYFTEDNKTYYSCNDYRFKNNVKCFSIIPRQNIILTFVQVQIVNSRLACYMITHSALPKDFSLKLKINILTAKSSRNLEDAEEKEIILTTQDETNGSTNSIVGFYSEQMFENEDEEIKVNQINFNSGNSVTQTVLSKNNCSLQFDSSSLLVNTKKVKEMINAKKIPDCSQVQPDNIIEFTIEDIDGCEFNLFSKTPTNFSDTILNLNLKEYDNENEVIISQCDTKKKNIKTIKCKVYNNTDNDYTFKDSVISESSKFITLSSEEEKFHISCLKNKSNSKKKLIIIIAVCCAVIILAVAFIVVIIIIRKKKNKNNIKESNVSLPSKSENNKKVIIANDVKLDKLDTQIVQDKAETEDVFNVNRVENTENKNVLNINNIEKKELKTDENDVLYIKKSNNKSRKSRSKSKEKTKDKTNEELKVIKEELREIKEEIQGIKDYAKDNKKNKRKKQREISDESEEEDYPRMKKRSKSKDKHKK